MDAPRSLSGTFTRTRTSADWIATSSYERWELLIGDGAHVPAVATVPSAASARANEANAAIAIKRERIRRIHATLHLPGGQRKPSFPYKYTCRSIHIDMTY